MDYLYGKLNNEVKYREYKGSETNTASVTIDDSDTVSVDVKKVPNELTLTTINGDTYTYDGSEPASFDIRTQVTDKVEEGNNLPVTSDAVKGYVDSKAGALEYVGGEGNFTNINGGVTVKGRLNVDDGITSPTEPTASTDVANKGYVDDNFVAKVNTPAIVYATNATDGSPRAIPWNTSAVPNNVAVFDDKGCLRTGGPVSGASDYGSQCVNIRYADKTYVKKVTPTTTFDVAYIAKKDGTQSTMLIAQGVYQNTLAQRGAGGRLQVGAPVGVADATTKKYVDDADAKKLNLIGGTITGSLAIQGDLTVTGTTTTEKAQTLAVKDSVIVTNADGAELGSTLSGIAIRKDGENTYGVMYDPSGDSVKLGLGTLDAENKFTFNESGTDGKAIATRADSSALTDGDLVKWDGTTNSLVDSGKKTDDFVEKVTVTEGSNLAYVAKNNGTQGTIPITTAPASGAIAQRKQNGGALEVGTAVSDSDAMPKKQVEDGFVAKIEPISQTTTAYVVLGDGTPSGIRIDGIAQPNSLAYRSTGGVLRVGTPVGVNDATTKKYVDDADSKKVNLIDGLTAGAVVYATETANGTTIGIPYSANTPDSDSIVQRQQNGVIVVGTPTSDATDAAVNIEYANAHYVTKTTQNNVVYGTGNNGNPEYTHFGYNPAAWNITKFDGTGCLRTNNPTGDDGRLCVNKQYADAHYVKSVAGTTNAPAVYIRGQDGTDKTASLDSLTASAYSVAQRDVNGNIKVGTASANGDAVNKQYAEDNFVTKGTVNQAVYVRRSNGTDTMIPYTDGSSQETIAYRGVGGVLGVGTPTQAGHATTKAYVDNLNTITITAGA